MREFSRRQSCILCIVRVEGYVGPCMLCIVCPLPLVNLHTFIFLPNYIIFFFLMDFGVVGGLIVVGIDVFLQPFVCNVADDFSVITVPLRYLITCFAETM
jgi:hypothetical protein